MSLIRILTNVYSAAHVPEGYRDLLGSKDSILSEYYPLDFQLDSNGKKQEWKAVVLLKHIDLDILLRVLQPRWADRSRWSLEERQRNEHGIGKLCVYRSHPLFRRLMPIHRDPRRTEVSFFFPAYLYYLANFCEISR